MIAERRPKEILIAILTLISLSILAYTRLHSLEPVHSTRNFSGPIEEVVPLKDTDRFSVAILGDCRGNTEAMEKVIHHARMNSDFAFILGDLILHGEQKYFHFFIRELNEYQGNLPVFTVIGNHDLDRDKKGRLFEEYFGPYHFYMMCGKTLFIAINNVEEGVWDEELAWLDHVLYEKARDADLVFLLMHKQPFYEHAKRHKPLSLEETSSLMQVIHHYQVAAIFAGHFHGYKNYEYEGIPVYVSGEAGAIQVRQPPDFGYLLLHVENREYRVDHVQLGNIFDWDIFEYYCLVVLHSYWPFICALCFAILIIMWYQSRIKFQSSINK
jgi:predicted phosphodiesterase